jgi:hypothetical protein
LYAASYDVRLDSAAGCFDFGKFWHGMASDRSGSSLDSHGPPNDLQRFARLWRLIKHERLWVAAGPSCKENPCGARNPERNTACRHPIFGLLLKTAATLYQPPRAHNRFHEMWSEQEKGPVSCLTGPFFMT